MAADKAVKPRKEAILYIVFGLLTTLVNLLIYQVGLLAQLDYAYANTIAFVISIIFAYVTNKIIVFKSKQEALTGLLVEFMKFIASRLGTFFLEMLGLWILIDIIGLDEVMPKYLMTAVVIVLNYFLSKWLVFKKAK